MIIETIDTKEYKSHNFDTAVLIRKTDKQLTFMVESKHVPLSVNFFDDGKWQIVFKDGENVAIANMYFISELAGVTILTVYTPR